MNLCRATVAGAATARYRTQVTEMPLRGAGCAGARDSWLRVEIDGKPVAEVGPGAIVGELALLHQGRRMATLRAVTPCRVAVVPKDRIDRQALEEIAMGRMSPPER